MSHPIDTLSPGVPSRRPGPLWSALACWLLAILVCGAVVGEAKAQTWSSRNRPRLRQIVSVDGTGEERWPYGREDVARDGLDAFELDEAGADLRTVYADADGKRVWIRAYVAADLAPPSSFEAFFFIDIDVRDDTGGPAFGNTLSTRWNSDLTRGGYERAVGVRADGSLIGMYRWNETSESWVLLPVDEPDDVQVELGVGEDPIRIGTRTHGYVQISVVHELSGLNVSCDGNLFVRTWSDDAAPPQKRRSFGDDDEEFYQCRAPRDSYGDPYVIRSVKCRDDGDCPNDGRCVDDVCLFAYPCEIDADCAEDEQCSGGACVRAGTASCTDNSQCEGLVCQANACVPCDDAAGRACDAGLECSPNGSCVDVGDFDLGDGGPQRGVVRGGAFHCAATGAGRPFHLGLWLMVLGSAWGYRRRSRREGRGR